MKRFVLILLLCIVPPQLSSANEKLDSVLKELDVAIAENQIYNDIKKKQIQIIYNIAAKSDSFSQERYNANELLYREYKAYKCDSAIYYLNQNIELAKHLKDKYRVDQATIELSSLFTSVGMYKEASDLLVGLCREEVPPSLLAEYYDAHNSLYGESAFYSQDPVFSKKYRKLSNLYKDSLFMTLADDSPMMWHQLEIKYMDSGLFDESLAMSDLILGGIQPMTQEFAVATFHRAITYRNVGDRDNYIYYLALSAISDVKAAIKDHASLWMLAEELYKDGNMRKAYEYIEFSWVGTVFFNARLRSVQSSQIHSIINLTHQATIEKQNKSLRVNLILISTLLLLLILALVYIYVQMRRLSSTQKELRFANSQLHELNDELVMKNREMEEANIELSESNQIKEEYIGRFIKLCSTYIDKLDSYRRMVNKMLMNGETNALLRITRSPEFMEETLNELYTIFDGAFLKLFPNFVEDFNDMLKPEEQIVLKKGEMLNTELRIFALIRLGIDDSSKIAEFLRYSVNTIYNYRAKVKSKANVGRDDFEAKIKMMR